MLIFEKTLTSSSNFNKKGIALSWLSAPVTDRKNKLVEKEKTRRNLNLMIFKQSYQLNDGLIANNYIYYWP